MSYDRNQLMEYLRDEQFVDRSSLSVVDLRESIHGKTVKEWVDEAGEESREGFEGQERFYGMMAQDIGSHNLPLFELFKSQMYPIIVWGIDNILRNGIMRGDRVLDIGCSTGLESVFIGKMVGDTGEVYGVDIVPGFLERARVRARRRNLGNVHFSIANRDRLPFDDNYFDSAVSVCSFTEGDTECYGPDGQYVINHILGERAKEWHRVVRTGGKLFVNEPSDPRLQDYDKSRISGFFQYAGFDVEQVIQNGPRKIFDNGESSSVISVIARKV